MNQLDAPLWEALLSYKRKEVIPFHTPGHKLRSGVFPNVAKETGSTLFELDSCDEVEALHFNHEYEMLLEQAQELAAKLFGAKQSFFLVNGTTQGIHAVLMPFSGTIIVPRFSHQAVYEGIVLSGGNVKYVPAQFDDDWGLALPPSLEQLENSLTDECGQLLVLTNPTYYGLTLELEAIVTKAHNCGSFVFVDEAHGGHFHFSSRLPSSAMAVGADMSVQSTHKTLGSLTQTSMLHCRTSPLLGNIIKAVSMLETTSPSLILLGLLDAVRRELALQGHSLVEEALELADYLRMKLRNIPGISLRPTNSLDDPTKVIVSMKEIGLPGTVVEMLLRRDYNIQVELSDYYNVLILITLGDTKERIDRLVTALEGVVARYNRAEPLSPMLSFPSLPPKRISPRIGLFAKSESVAIKDAVGRVSAGFVTPYPPGVPLIVPGEEYTDSIVDHIRQCEALGWKVRGLRAEKVAVIKDIDDFCRKI